MYEKPERQDVLKLAILDSIKQSREAIKLFNKMIVKFPELASVCHDIIEHEQSSIRKDFNDLVALKRRRVTD